MKVGDRVVISFNPHRDGDHDIVGTVVAWKPGEGLMGCDLAYVRYTSPADGTEHELPFAAYNLLADDRAALLARAERHEEQAGRLREMAGEWRPRHRAHLKPLNPADSVPPQPERTP